VRGRVEDELERSRQPPDPLGVNSELVDQADRLLGEDHPGREPEQRQPQNGSAVIGVQVCRSAVERL
jgi:hypothetical protein